MSSNSPPMEGLIWRPATVSDAAALSALFNSAAEAEGVPERMSPETMEHELTSPHADLERKTIVAVAADGKMAARGSVWFRPSEAEEHRAYLSPIVAPQWRGKGLEEYVTDWCIATAEAILGGLVDDLPRYLDRWVFQFQDEEQRRFTDRGFVPVRYFWEMERPLGGESAGIDDPDGVMIVPWTGDLDAPALDVHNAAFADHWGSRPIPLDSWMHDQVGSTGFRRHLSFCAVAGALTVGYCFAEVYPEDWEAAGRSEGWIGGLGVIREYRKRGVATALMNRSFAAMEGDGLEFAMIGVDSANPSGAHRLYESVGFRTRHRAMILERALP